MRVLCLLHYKKHKDAYAKKLTMRYGRIENRYSPFSFLSALLLFKLAANSLTDLFSTLVLLNELAVLLADNVGGKEAGPLTPLSVDSSRASPESGVLPAEVFGLEPSLNRLNSPVRD